ncbi:MAG TPA: hypothetical protein VNG35_02225 [Gemmatimonadales bacterium]|nr:hypothetical protein [Gemmatimonadales bacterium]
MMPNALKRRRWFPAHLWVVATAAFFLSCGGATPIKTLLDDPQRFDGKTVRIAGQVQGSVGALGFGAYQVNDGTGTLSIVSEGGGVPRQGAKVGVEGTFRAAYTLGNQSVAVLVEQRRYTP